MATSRDAKLQTYRAKRNKDKTPEPYPPSGRAKKAAGTRRAKGQSFVIQEHHARALHWDFRLERDGVLVSWALPKGLPMDPGQNHLAVPTEDHPLEYGSFEGTIPQGEYGGGNVTIWDSGTYDCEKWNEKEVMITLHGKGQAQGRYVLFPTGPKRWMIHRMDPAPAQWAPLPEKMAPMLCTLGQLPARDEGWAYEFKWDGERIIAFIEGGRIRLVTRNGNDVTGTYPELADLAESVGARPMVLDGEVVAYDGEHPSFSLLQSRMRVTDRNRARKLAQDTPVTYLVFDVLYLDGASTTDLSYDQRRRLLDGLHLAGPRWQTPPTFTDAVGPDILQISKDHGLEGVVVKRRESRYRPGRRSPDWIKVKNIRTQEVVVGGWTQGAGNRSGTIGALLLGIPDDGGLRYVGKVGTGFNAASLDDIARRLKPLGRKTSPFSTTLPKAQVAAARWVTPSTVGEVQFSEWTRDGQLRHPSWRGLRPDKSPSDVVLEE